MAEPPLQKHNSGAVKHCYFEHLVTGKNKTKQNTAPPYFSVDISEISEKYHKGQNCVNTENKTTAPTLW